MAKSANLYARIEPDVKEQAEGNLASPGISVSNAINVYYMQSILHRGIPFELKLPNRRQVDMIQLTAVHMDAELEKGYADAQEGRTKPVSHAFADIRKDYNV